MGKCDSDKKVTKKNEDVICLNCFSAEDLKEPDPVPLNKIRKEHREKLKLYSFLASEISRPRAVPLKQRVSEPYAIGKKIDEKISKNPKFSKYAPKKVIAEKQIIYLDNNIQNRDVDSSTVSDSTSISNVYEVKGTVKQEEITSQSKFNDISSDQISLAESVNESTDVTRNSIKTEQKMDPEELDDSSDLNAVQLKGKNRYSENNNHITIQKKNENKTEVKSIQSKPSQSLFGNSKVKRKILEDAYLPKNLLKELNEADIYQSSESIPQNIAGPVSKKIKPEKVKKSSKLFKLFSRSKSSKDSNGNPDSNTIFESDEVTHVNSNVEPVITSYNEVSVDEKFEKLFERNSLIDSPKTTSTQLNFINKSHEESIDDKFEKLVYCKDDVSIYGNMDETNISTCTENLNTILDGSVIQANKAPKSMQRKVNTLSEVSIKPKKALHIAQVTDGTRHEIDSLNHTPDNHNVLHDTVINENANSSPNSKEEVTSSNSSVIKLSDILIDDITESSIDSRTNDLRLPSKLHIVDEDTTSQHDEYKKLTKKDSLDFAYYSSQELNEDLCVTEISSSYLHEIKRERKQTPMPSNEFLSSLYYNRESGIIPEEPENLGSDEEMRQSPPVYNKTFGNMRNVFNSSKVKDKSEDSIVYSKLNAPISTTPKSTKILINHKDLDAEINTTKSERIKRDVDINAANGSIYENVYPISEPAEHDLSDFPDNAEQLTMHYKLQIETPSPSGKEKGQDHTVVPCSIIVSPAKPKRIFVESPVQENEYHSLESRAESDKVDNVSSHGSDSGYTGSSNYLESAKTPTPPESLPASPEPNISKCNTIISEEFRCSMPALNKTSESDKNLTAYSTNSLRVDRSLEKHHDKKLRWSTLSICKKPYDVDDEVFSETLSPGHATLPRRSNSPLPHERDLDRDRFPINRSGLQARSESMASVYSGAGEGTRASVTVRGDVQFSLLYNYRLGALEVGVKRCRDLAAVDVKRNRSDPYVKVYLLPDKSKAGKRKTKVKKNTLNPVFEENLSFIQPLSSLSSRTLWLSVWHADMFGRNDFLGEVTLPLADVVFDDPAPQWHKLHERTEQFDEQHGSRGDLIVGLKFELQEGSGRGQTKGTLHVLVKEAKNLLATKPNGLADVFCKSYLLPERGRLAKQKTSVARRTLNPRWEHTFTYRGLTLQELSTRALELSLWDRDRLASNDFMGAIRLSLGTGTYMGASVNWMDSVGKEVSLWQTMMQRPNFWVEGSLPLRPQLSN
ncbi:hypothetical protein O0L34_g4571 [Tuta absoluta]|nr:hypothetical protein O0L34_g4571 [Tuta absoluta]